MANRFFRNVGTGWGTSTNWSTTDGGGADAAVPVAGDAVFLTALSNALCSVAASSACGSVNCTGYTGTLAFGANTITLSGLAGVNSVTFSSGMTITATSGTIISNQSGGTSIWTANGKTFPSTIVLNGSSSPVFSFADAWNITGALSLGGGTKTLGGAGSITVGTNLTVNADTAGGCTVILGGTGTWSGTNTLSNNLTINTSGTITLSGTLSYSASGSRTLTYTAGTVSAGSSTLSLEGDCTLNTAGISWFNVTLNAAMTVTNNSLCTITGTLTHVTGNKVWAGTAGFTAANLIIQSTTAATHTFAASKTYTLTTLIQEILSNPAAHPVIQSGTGGTKTNLTLSRGCICTLGYVDFTDVDASGGRTIDAFNGVLSNTVNVNSYQDPTRTVAKSYSA